MKKFIAFVIILALSVGIGFGAQCIEKAGIKKNHPRMYSALVEKYAAEYEIPEDLLYAVIKCESGFNCEAVSSAGAKGLMQLMPATFEEMTKRCGESFEEGMMFDAEASIKYGSYYLHYLYGIFSDWDLCLAAYNGGMGNVRKWMQDSDYYDGVKIIKYPDGFAETENYVAKVNEARKIYKELYYSEA